MLQEYGLFPWKTTEANITLGARMRKIDVPEKAVERLKKELGIEGLDRLYPQQISGGQRQRVALARALLLEPRLLILDEPFAAVDMITRERLQSHLLDLFHTRDFSFILVTHNIEEAVYLGQRIAVMDDGAPAKIDIIDNPGFGDMDFRESPEFFLQTSRLRRMLGKPPGS